MRVIGDERDGWALTPIASVALEGYLLVSLTLLGIGTLLTGPLRHGPVGRWDAEATAWLAEHRVGWANGFTEVVSRSADTLGIVVLATIVVAVLMWRHLRRHAAVVVLALTLELTVFLLVSSVVDRPRPDVARLGSTPSTSSFPSGHSAAAMALYGTVALFVWLRSDRRGWRILAVTMAIVMPVGVAFSRVYRGMHQPIDVLFGLGMGAAVATVAGLSSAEHAELAAARKRIRELEAELAVHRRATELLKGETRPRGGSRPSRWSRRPGWLPSESTT